MRKALLLSFALAASLVGAACGNSTSTLTGTTWYLTGATEKVPAWQWALPPAEQSSYTIIFNTDGSFASKADCNQVGGTYTTSGKDGITITPGLSTMAFCGEDSKDVLYLG